MVRVICIRKIIVTRNTKHHGFRLLLQRQMPPQKNIPRSALLLGWSGVLPFALLAGLIEADVNVTDVVDPRAALITYAAIIISFMGGVHWGMAISDEASGGADSSTQALRLVFSIAPALVGWLATFFIFGVAVILLIGAFVVLVIYDIWAATQQWAPTWHPRLRMQLTTAVVAALALAWGSGL